MTNQKPRVLAAVDLLLARIKVNGKSLSMLRLQWWLVIVLTRLFGSSVQIEGGERKSLRLLPIVWRKKLYLLGSEHEALQIDYTSPYTLRVKVAPFWALSEGVAIQPGARTSRVHVVLSHLPPEKTDIILNHLATLAGNSYALILAYGGTAKNFDAISYARKIFIADNKLRGLGYRQSYFCLMDAVATYLKKEGIDPEWVFISDYDLLPLRNDYLADLIALMEKCGAGFGAKLIQDVSLSNKFFLTNAINDGIMDRMPMLNGSGKQPVSHCLGCAMLFHRDCFDAVRQMKSDFEDMYFEIALPTAAGLKGFRLLSIDKHTNAFQHVRYRPIYSYADVLHLARDGAAFIHPIKDIAEFIAAVRASA